MRKIPYQANRVIGVLYVMLARDSLCCSDDYPQPIQSDSLGQWQRNCYDNAAVETVFKTIKTELI
jgi:hypothetical protein